MFNFLVENEVIAIRDFLKSDLDEFKKFTPYENLLLSDYNLCFLDSADLKFWISNIKNRKNRYFAILLKGENNRLIGYLAVKKNNSFSGQYELAISLDAKYSSNGYGFISLKLFFDYYFKNINKSIWLNVNSFNRRAISLYEKIGFQKISEFYGEFEVQNFKDTRTFLENKEDFMVNKNVIFTRIFSMKLDEYSFMERWG